MRARDRLTATATYRPHALDAQQVLGCATPGHEPTCRVHVQHFVVEMALGTDSPAPDTFRPDGVVRVEVHR